MSGWTIKFALLRFGAGRTLENLLFSDVDRSNQGQHGFLQDATLSDHKIFVTANHAWSQTKVTSARTAI